MIHTMALGEVLVSGRGQGNPGTTGGGLHTTNTE